MTVVELINTGEADNRKGPVARRVITQLINDLSGVPFVDGKGENVDFSYHGQACNANLTGKEAAGFDKSIAMYSEHATKAGGRSGRRNTSDAGTGSRDKDELANSRS